MKLTFVVDTNALDTTESTFDAEETILEFKHRMDGYGCWCCWRRQVFTYNGQVLDNDRTFYDYEIPEGSTIIVSFLKDFSETGWTLENLVLSTLSEQVSSRIELEENAMAADDCAEEPMDQSGSSEPEMLNPDLQRELCISVISELMDCSSYDEGVMDHVRRAAFTEYHPGLAHKYILSGKLQFAAFLDICKSVKELRVEDGGFHAIFDKNVCLTANDPCCVESYAFSTSFFVDLLFKYTRSMTVDTYCACYSEMASPRFASMQNVDELEFCCTYNSDHFDKLCDLFSKVKPVRKMISNIDAYLDIDKIVTKYKLDRMIAYVQLDELNPLFAMNNLIPEDLYLRIFSDGIHSVCQQFVTDFKNDAFVELKKLVLIFDLFEEWPFVFTDGLMLMMEAIQSIEKKFPILKELVFDCELRPKLFTDRQFVDCVDEMKPAIRFCERMLEKYRGNFKLKVNWKFSHPIGEYDGVLLAALKTKFPGFFYSVKALEHPEHVWKKRIGRSSFEVKIVHPSSLW